jgi:hypothetical protein
MTQNLNQQIPIPCTHLQSPHPKGHQVTIPCTHLQFPHSQGDIITIPCTHFGPRHPKGDTVTVPCIHTKLKHPKGHKTRFGVRIPCAHITTKKDCSLYSFSNTKTSQRPREKSALYT